LPLRLLWPLDHETISDGQHQGRLAMECAGSWDCNYLDSCASRGCCMGAATVVCSPIDLTDQLGATAWTDTPIPVGFCPGTRTGSFCPLAYERSDHAAERFDSASY